MIAIIDYGAGNLKSVRHALELLEMESIITSNPEDLDKAKALILPGVGAFGDAMETLKTLELVEPIKRNANAGKPILGICLGMQLFFEVSYENGKWEGLGLIPGEVVRFEHDLKIPHIGWNNLIEGTKSEFSQCITEEEYVYFVHSFYVKPQNVEDILFWTDYGDKFPAAVKRNNLIGMQFHPEKSAATGIKLLKVFKELISK